MLKARIAIIAIILCLLIIAGCGIDASPGGSGGHGFPKPVSLWKGVELVPSLHKLTPRLSSSDIVLDGLGEVVAVKDHPDEPRQIIIVDWLDNFLTVHHVDLQARQAKALAAVAIDGPRPRLTVYQWPRLLFEAKDDKGNYNWLLLDLGGEEPEIIWQHFAWVPQALRRRPVWCHGSQWYLAPLTGPVIKEVLTEQTFTLSEPLSAAGEWPNWAGPGGDRYLYPGKDGLPRLLNLATGQADTLSAVQDFAWSRDRNLLAWRQEDQLGVLGLGAGSTQAELTTSPGAPLWASDEDLVFFLGGDRDFLGLLWKELYLWDMKEEPHLVLTLPGNWSRWRLQQASSMAVLAVAGEKLDCWYYFDLASDTRLEIKSISGNWFWRNGHFLAVVEGELIRISPGFGRRVIQRSQEPIVLLGLVSNYIVFTLEGEVRVRQLAI